MPLGTEVGVGPGDIVLDGDPVPLKGTQPPPPNFRPMSVVAKRSPISAIAEHLSFNRPTCMHTAQTAYYHCTFSVQKVNFCS